LAEGNEFKASKGLIDSSRCVILENTLSSARAMLQTVYK